MVSNAAADRMGKGGGNQCEVITANEVRNSAGGSFAACLLRSLHKVFHFLKFINGKVLVAFEYGDSTSSAEKCILPTGEAFHRE